jgi:hypothetical protein
MRPSSRPDAWVCWLRRRWAAVIGVPLAVQRGRSLAARTAAAADGDGSSVRRAYGHRRPRPGRYAQPRRAAAGPWSAERVLMAVGVRCNGEPLISRGPGGESTSSRPCTSPPCSHVGFIGRGRSYCSPQARIGKQTRGTLGAHSRCKISVLPSHGERPVLFSMFLRASCSAV